MNVRRSFIEQRLVRSMANFSFSVMYHQVRAIEKSGVSMMHTARSFSYYRKIFYRGMNEAEVLQSLEGKRILDVGCGHTPYANDSMFQACYRAGVEFYGIDPVIANKPTFGFKERALARALGSKGQFCAKADGLSKALPAFAQELPFDDQSVDEILCSYLLFVWIEDEQVLAEILQEFCRVLKPGGMAKLYPLYEWTRMNFTVPSLLGVLRQFQVTQSFVHGGLDLRITPSLMTQLSKVT